MLPHVTQCICWVVALLVTCCVAFSLVRAAPILAVRKVKKANAQQGRAGLVLVYMQLLCVVWALSWLRDGELATPAWSRQSGFRAHHLKMRTTPPTYNTFVFF